MASLISKRVIVGGVVLALLVIPIVIDTLVLAPRAKQHARVRVQQANMTTQPRD